MSFSEEVKKELSQQPERGSNAQVAGLAALLSCIGSFRVDESGKWQLYVSGENRLAQTKCFTLLRKTANINCKSEPSGKYARALASSREIRSVCRLVDAMGEDRMPKPPGSGVSYVLLCDEGSIRSYLRNMFLCTGSVSSPDSEYRLEFTCSGAEEAEQIRRLLTEEGIPVKVTERRKAQIVYSRDADTIADLLTLMGAQGSVLKLENSRVMKQMRGSVNRQVNCETANLRKTADAALRQLEDIRIIRKAGKFESLPPSLKEAARLREEFPECSLSELAEKLNPPIGKSGMNHRFRKLESIAAKAPSESGKLEESKRS